MNYNINAGRPQGSTVRIGAKCGAISTVHWGGAQPITGVDAREQPQDRRDKAGGERIQSLTLHHDAHHITLGHGAAGRGTEPSPRRRSCCKAEQAKVRIGQPVRDNSLPVTSAYSEPLILLARLPLQNSNP
ncbi:hypothetical protein TPAR_01090 [Tolypocladium paradoxum]|uniref:Uncharacterized protein n=1 Tax=Tolypocladium paradoxum TaxID=94208 RepID=A0A2S4L8D4_9HYPO|nr:hypothetical protein TPAR_01090 [Tolypocladium paradoxum]